MPHGDPSLDSEAEFMGLLENLAGLGFTDHGGHVVIERVALSSTRLEVGGELGNLGTDRQFTSLEGRLVRSEPNDPVARTGNRHFRKLQGCIVRGREPSIIRKPGQCGVAKVTLDYTPKRVKFSFTRPVGYDSVIRQQWIPGHARRPG